MNARKVIKKNVSNNLPLPSPALTVRPRSARGSNPSKTSVLSSVLSTGDVVLRLLNMSKASSMLLFVTPLLVAAGGAAGDIWGAKASGTDERDWVVVVAALEPQGLCGVADCGCEPVLITVQGSDWWEPDKFPLHKINNTQTLHDQYYSNNFQYINNNSNNKTKKHSREQQSHFI